jgi:hypothetical protein
MDTKSGQFQFNSFESGINKKQQAELESVPEPVIEYQDMPVALVEYALERGKLAYLALKKGDVQYWKDVAEMIKKDFDDNKEKTGGPTWHVIVGTHFGSFHSTEARRLIFFSVGHMKILIYKHG